MPTENEYDMELSFVAESREWTHEDFLGKLENAVYKVYWHFYHRDPN